MNTEIVKTSLIILSSVVFSNTVLKLNPTLRWIISHDVVIFLILTATYYISNRNIVSAAISGILLTVLAKLATRETPYSLNENPINIITSLSPN